eukprot:NODE_31_length_37178_cov_0.413576.p13 type:complete len:289 gc:universal NODE_31_length_37178_cov_0.413576:35319-36185(+)
MITSEAEYEKYVKITKQGQHEIAFQGLLKCAHDGNVEAMWDVGSMLLQGRGTEKNLKAAEKWLRQAAEKNNDGRIFLGDLYTEKEMYDKAVLEYQIALNSGDEVDRNDASCALGDIYLHHIKHYPLARHYYMIAGENHPDSVFGLGQVAEMVGNYTAAFKYYETASKLGHEDSLIQMALCYAKGKGVQKNFQTAVKILKNAGTSETEYELAQLYLTDSGLVNALDMAIPIFFRAAEKGNMMAKMKLADIASDLMNDSNVKSKRSQGLTLAYELNDLFPETAEQINFEF